MRASIRAGTGFLQPSREGVMLVYTRMERYMDLENILMLGPNDLLMLCEDYKKKSQELNPNFLDLSHWGAEACHLSSYGTLRKS